MFERLKVYTSFVRFGHSVFALPFALTGALLATREAVITLDRICWIVAAMVFARTAAMGFNRLVDAPFDALNPRTSGRELPRGSISYGEAKALVIFSSCFFVGVCTQINLLCTVLSPVALTIIFWYSLAKRYTSYTQLFLGLSMAVTPIGGWLAAGGRAGVEPWLLGLAIGTWVGGFDVLYACQDFDFDRNHGLRSIPVKFGIRRSLQISRSLHVVTVIALAALSIVAPLGWIYLVGVVGVAALLTYEQFLVRHDDLSRLKEAFDLNGYVGIFYLATTALSIYA